MRIKLKQDKESIIKILKSDDVEKKFKILERLDSVDDKESIKILMKMLEDRSWSMREQAAHRLASYGSRVCARLQRLLKKGYWYTRASACLALGEIADLQTTESIVDVLLKDENPTVLKEASAALVKMARKKPEKFAVRLNAIDVKASDLRTILFALEKNDIELYREIKALTIDERQDV
ncbi:MAG: HEAT repeat domain-containing protein [candidate division WOR-3 bacterium]|nr:MAG: HEAT repeat domain-containing protein [candidate division WOR-3 bacterium]